MFTKAFKDKNHPCFKSIYLIANKIFIFLVMIFSFEVYSQDNIVPYQLSKRTGDEIDRQERDYFYLFPNIKDFEMAKAYRLSNYSIKIEIQQTKQSGKPDTMLIITMPESQGLANYLTDFEQIFNQYKVVQLHNINSELINLFVARQKFNWLLKKHKKREFDQFIVIDLDSSQYSGTVLYANDSLVVLWNDTSFYDWRKISENLKIFHYSEIDKIIIGREGGFLSGAGTGFLIGGGIGAVAGLASGSDSEGIIQFSAGTKALFGGLFFGVTGGLIGGVWGAAQGTDDEIIINYNEMTYKNFLPVLKESAVFPNHVPPEIFDSMKSKNEREIPQSAKAEKLIVTQPTKEFSNQKVGVSGTSIATNNKLHISFMASYSNTIANNDMINAFEKSGFGGSYYSWFGNVDYPSDQSNILTWHIETSYGFHNNYCFGLGVKKIAPQEVHGINNLSEDAEGYAGNLFADWIVDPYELNTLDRWEHMLGIGLTYNKIKINRSIGYFSARESVDKNVYGLQLRGAIDYYPSPSLSFQIKLIVDIVQPINLDEFKSDEVEEVLQKHSINFSGFDIGVGMHIHL